MTRVSLLQLDGALPNIALMRLAAHHRALGKLKTKDDLAQVMAVISRSTL